MNKKIVVAILLLCVALCMGCIGEPLNTPASVFVEEPETKLDVLTPQPVIKFSSDASCRVDDFRAKYDVPLNYSYPVTGETIKVI